MTGPAILTTSWDDGHPLDQRVAELLMKYGIAGTFYVTFANCLPVMTPDQIRRIGNSFELGAHTLHHAVLRSVPDHIAEYEISASKKQIEDLTGQPCEAFCFPKGCYGRQHIGMVRRAGFRSARTVELLSTAYPRTESGVLLVPTTIQANPHHWTAYLKNAARRLAVRNLGRSIFLARSKDWVNTAINLLNIVVRRGGVFHLWGHSWEVDENQQWSQLETVLNEMSQLRTYVRYVPNSKISF